MKDQPFVRSQKMSSATPYTVHGAWTTALEGAVRQAAGLVAAEIRAKPAAYWAGVSAPARGAPVRSFKGSRGSRGTADVTAAGTGSGAPAGTLRLEPPLTQHAIRKIAMNTWSKRDWARKSRIGSRKKAPSVSQIRAINHSTKAMPRNQKSMLGVIFASPRLL